MGKFFSSTIICVFGNNIGKKFGDGLMVVEGIFFGLLLQNFSLQTVYGGGLYG